MRLTRLRIEKYGCFERADLAFAAEAGRINLIVAPNGAGKSLLRQAFHDLLFDIPAQTPMKFRFGYPGMALHADALAEDGAPFSFGWARQGKPPRTTNDPARYAALREQTTPRQLEQLFALDTIRLRRGGLDLKGGETLAEALLSGTGELARPRRVLAEIEARRTANWGAGKSKPPLNAALAKLNEARRAMRAAVERPEHRERAQRALEAQRQVVAQARAARAAADQTRQRLHRIELTRPMLGQLAEAQAWLDAHPDAPALPASLEKELAEARGALCTTEATLLAAKAGAEAAAQALGAIVRDEAATRLAEQLAALPEQLGSADKARIDIVGVAAELHAAELGIRNALRDIGAQVGLDEAAGLVPTVSLLAEARAAILSHERLSTRRSQAADQLRDAARRLAATAQAPAEAQPAPSGLAALLSEIRADRDPAQHEKDLSRLGRQAAAELQAALALVPGWSGGAAALRDLAVPLPAYFQRLDAARTKADQAAELRANDCGALAAQGEETRLALSALHATPLPDEASVTAARQDRDRGWRLIHQRAFSGMAPDADAERAFAGEEPLPLAFERRLRIADTLADQRMAQLARVTEAARLGRVLADLAIRHTEAEGEASFARDSLAAARGAWGQAAAPLGLAADASLGEVTAFLAFRTGVIEAMKADELARGEAASLRQVHEGWAARLTTLLPVGCVNPAMGLGERLAVADAIVTRATMAQHVWLTWQADHRAAQREHHAEADRLAQTVAAFAAWEGTWAAILDQLGRPGAESPRATEAVLDRIAQLDTHHHEAEGFRARVQGMQAVLDRFAIEVGALCAALDVAPGDCFAAARALIIRRDEAAHAAGAWGSANERVAQAAHVLEQARQAHQLAERARDGVIAASGAESLEEAERRIAASREHGRHTEMRAAALAALAAHGGGLPIATLRQQAGEVAPESMAACGQAAEEAAAEADARGLAAGITLRTLEDAFAAGAEETRALAAASDYAAAAAQYSRVLEEQLLLHLAHDMLHHALEAVQAEAGDDGIARLSRVFSAVTAGAYGVALSEEDGATLHAIEARFPGEPKTLDQLSEGTRDQLYLALRILALREHAAGAMPLPFIADDILQTFDDLRAEAALRALAELSQDVQVIVLTHHAHLAGVAESLGEAVHVQVLS